MYPQDSQASTSYMVPRKRILSKEHLAAFSLSATHGDIVAFVDDLNDAVVGKKLSENVESEVGDGGYSILTTAYSPIGSHAGLGDGHRGTDPSG